MQRSIVYQAPFVDVKSRESRKRIDCVLVGYSHQKLFEARCHIALSQEARSFV